MGVHNQDLGACLRLLKGEGRPSLGHRLQIHRLLCPVEQGDALGIDIARAAAGDGFFLDLVRGHRLQILLFLRLLRGGLLRFFPWAWPADSAAHWASRAESPSSSRCQKGTGPSPPGPGPPWRSGFLPVPQPSQGLGQARRDRRHAHSHNGQQTGNAAPQEAADLSPGFLFFIGITLPYASILCTAVQVQNLSPAEKEVPP